MGCNQTSMKSKHYLVLKQASPTMPISLKTEENTGMKLRKSVYGLVVAQRHV